MTFYGKQEFDGPAMIRLLWRKKWWIIVPTVITAFFTVIITLALPKKYLASGIVFPPSANNLEMLLNQPRYGYDMEADRLIQMLKSESLRDSIVKTHNLLAYYEIDTTSPSWNKELNQKFYADVDFTRTRYMSVVISAHMDSPQLSADIVNTCIDKVDELRERVFKKGLAQQMKSLQAIYSQKEKEMKALGDSLYRLSQRPGKESLRLLYYQMKFGRGLILDQNSMSRLLEASGRNNVKPADELLATNYLGSQQQLQEIRKKMDALESLMKQPVPGVYVVDRAHPSYESVTPSVKKNLVIAGGGAFFLSMLILLLVHRLRDIFQPA